MRLGFGQRWASSGPAAPTAAPNQPPVAVVSPTSASVAVNEVLQIDGSGSYDPDGTVVAWNWTGPGSVGASPWLWNFSSSKTGTYYVYLQVVDDDGATSTSAVCTVTVTSGLPGG